MFQRPFVTRQRTLLPLMFTALLGVSLSGCMSGSERRHANLQEDTGTCNSFGSAYGSGAYNECMLTQQNRCDQRARESLERTRLTSQIARDAQVMADRARRQRCDRNPDRRECGPRGR